MFEKYLSLKEKNFVINMFKITSAQSQQVFNCILRFFEIVETLKFLAKMVLDLEVKKNLLRLKTSLLQGYYFMKV